MKADLEGLFSFTVGAFEVLSTPQATNQTTVPFCVINTPAHQQRKMDRKKQ